MKHSTLWIILSGLLCLLIHPLQSVAEESLFVPVTPCRVIDTRDPDQGKLAINETRAFDIVGVNDYSNQGGNSSGCGIPGFGGAPLTAIVQSIAINVVAVQPEGVGVLKIGPGDVEPTRSLLNYPSQSVLPTLGNAIIVPVRQDMQGDDIKINTNQPVHVVADITGYFTKFVEDRTFNMGISEGDQTISFFNAGSQGSEYIRWDDSENDFRITDDIYLGVEGDEANPITIKNNWDLWFQTEADNGTGGQLAAWYRFFTGTGTVCAANGAGCRREQMRIEDGVNAAIRADGAFLSDNLDYAEAFKITDPTLEAGDVVSIDRNRVGFIQRTSSPYDPNIVGVISTSPGFLTGAGLSSEEQAAPEIAALRRAAAQAGDARRERELTIQLREAMEQQQRPVALAGRVPVKVVGPINAGDYLTSSSTPGHAMAMTQPGKSIGIALESFHGNQGKILALIQPGWFGDNQTQAAANVAAKSLTTDSLSFDESSQQLRLSLDSSSDFSIVPDANATAGEELLRLDAQGGLHLKGGVRPQAAGFAEYHPALGAVVAGDVVVADAFNPGWVSVTSQAADPAVIGIVTDNPGVATDADVLRAATQAQLDALQAARDTGDQATAAQIWAQLESDFEQTFMPVALSGTVPCKVDTSNGPIAVGDLLVASANPGYAMRADALPAPGTVVGKALEPLGSGNGIIKVIVMLR